MAYENNEMHYLNFFKTKSKKGKEKIEAFQYELLSEALGDIINDGAKKRKICWRKINIILFFQFKI